MKLILVVGLIILNSAFLFAGNSAGGGGDQKPFEYYAAWFVGQSPVHYCYEIAEGFGPPTSVIEETLRNVFQTWRDYIQAKGMNSILSPKGLSLALNTQQLPQCNGQEDLKFYFGVTNEEVAKVKATFVNPLGFAFRKSFDRAKGWGKGFIWVAPPNSVFPKESLPDWNVPYTLNGVLLHELGHVLGCSDIDGTIMEDWSLGSKLRWAVSHPLTGKAALTEIDGGQELMFGIGTEREFSGRIPAPLAIPDQPKLTFKRFMGREPVGKIWAKARVTSQNIPDYVLTLGDRKGAQEFLFHAGWNTDFGSRSWVFAVAKGDVISGMSHYGEVAYGKIASYPVIVTRNPSFVRGPLKIQYISENQPWDLFESISPEREAQAMDHG
jgi:hypothetical protein